MLALLLLTLGSAEAASYRCSVEFGERVLLAAVVDGKTQTWNAGVFDQRPNRSLEKWTHFTGTKSGGRYLTRYGVQAGESFTFDLTCLPKQKCQAAFSDKSRSKAIAVPKLYDTRTSATGRIEVQFTQRDAAGILVRVFKGPLSSSGEVKFFAEAERFSLDVGVDEPVVLSPDAQARLAALEAKLDCKR